MSTSSIHQLLAHELSDLYSAETQILASLKTAIDKVADEHLKNILAHHYKETEGHVARLEQVAQESEVTLDKGHVCKGMQGILAEGDEALSEFSDEALKDVAFALATRRVEHYEVAGYMSAISLAKAEDNMQIVNLLDQTLKEEHEADNKLVTLVEETLLKKISETA